jgi:hypothetical protein
VASPRCQEDPFAIDLSSAELKPPAFLSAGFIQFTTPGGTEVTGAAFEAVR